MMFAGGFRDPSKIFKADDVLGRMTPNSVAVRAPGRNYSAQEIRDVLTRAGITDAAGIAPDVDPHKGLQRLANQLTEATERAARARGAKDAPRGFKQAALWINRHKGELADDALSLGWARFGEKIAKDWDRTAKTAFFLDRLEKGDAINVALQRTFEVMFDYGDQSKFQRALGSGPLAMAFPGWFSRAIVEVPKAVGRTPGVLPIAANLPALAGTKPEDQAPKWAREKGPVGQMAPAQQAALNQGLQAAGVEPISPGARVGFQLRQPFSESVAPMLEAANGNFSPLVSNMNPVAQMGIEAAFGVDPMTRQKLLPPTPAGMFPQGTPGVPPELTTNTAPNDPEQQIPWLSRYAPQLLGTTPQAMVAMNWAMGGPYLGKHRVEAPNEGQRTALQILNMLTGNPMFLTDPMGPVNNMYDDPAVKAYEGYLPSYMRGKKNEALK